MSAMESQLTASLVFSQPFIQALIKENAKAPRHWPLWGKSTGHQWIPSQRASNAENVSIWWRHVLCFVLLTIHDQLLIDSCHVSRHSLQSDLTHRARATNIWVSELAIIGSDNGLSEPMFEQCWLISSTGHYRTVYSEIFIEIQTFSFKKIRLKMSSVIYRPFCLVLSVLKTDTGQWLANLWRSNQEEYD